MVWAGGTVGFVAGGSDGIGSGIGCVSGGVGAVSGGSGIVVGDGGTVAGGCATGGDSGSVVVVVSTTVEVVVDEDVVDCCGVVVVDSVDVVWGKEEVVDSIVVDTSVVVVATGLVLKASSGTISQPASSMFHANIRHDDPPFSYINNSSGTLAASRLRLPDIDQVQP
jgi:hypothetical protein